MVDIHPAQAFVDEYVAKVAPLSREAAEAYWQLNTTGDEKQAEIFADREAAVTRIHADREGFAKLKGWRGGIDDPVLARQVELLYLAFLGNQKDEETINRMAKLESELEMAYSNHRGGFEGKPTGDNDLRAVLRTETDSDRRRVAWEASKGVGSIVRDDLLEVVRLRNSVAHSLGFANYYRMSLELDELDQDELFELLDSLDELTREPFRVAKATLDTELASRYGVAVETLQPWHYGDFFFQEPPRMDGIDLDRFFADRDPVQLAGDTFSHIGLKTREILDRSDLHPREGKCQHAFCMDVDREGDVRVLCNMQADENWTGTLLHELGHAVYDQELDHELPYVLRSAAHSLSTEAIAMLMGRLSRRGSWLTEFAGADAVEVAALSGRLTAFESLAMLIFTRWCLVMTYFERDLYANPDQDLNALWWDHVERFQMVTRPEGRDEPDWAAKTHVATAPVYYHNYMMGEMMASQLQAYIDQNVDEKGAAGGPDVGRYLCDRVFHQGARYHWNDHLERATGERLTAHHFASQFVG
jgi:peptidyl-dipeptidase A